MALIPYRTETLTDAGATYSVDVTSAIDLFAIVPASNPLTMLANVVVNFTGTPSNGQEITVGWGEGITIGANSMTVNGVALTALQALKEGFITFTYLNGAWGDVYSMDLKKTGNLSGAVLQDSSLALAKISDLTSGTIPVGSAGGVATARTISGVITISNTGVAAFVALSIVNADISATAAIARSKTASGTANYVLINSAGGVMTEEQFLATSRGGFGVSVAAATGVATVSAGTFSFLSALTAALGGTGINSSASVGFPIIAAGTWSVAALTDAREKFVSFAADGVGTYEMLFPFPCIVTSIDAEVVNDIAATDNGTITFQDETATALVGNNLVAGVLSITLSSNTGSNFATTATANNVFAAGEKLKIITAKVTSGGSCNVTVTYTRLTLS